MAGLGIEAAALTAPEMAAATTRSTTTETRETDAARATGGRQPLSEQPACQLESKIVQFYENKSIFITGGSGFIGKVLIEKLARTIPNIGNIFVLIRPKWRRQVSERVEELLGQPIFNWIREQKLDHKIVFVEGDVTLPNLGLCEQDKCRILQEVGVVFHSAATVKFDEPLKQSVAINIVGTRSMIELCSKMHQLAAFVHISTAYANCDKAQVDEHVYPVDFDPERLIEMANWLDQETLQGLKAKLLGSRPNTYTYTKALAECLLVKCARDLPVAICRPSIVVASWKEPFSGWIDNVNGPTGVILGAGKGLVRTMRAQNSYVADLVPVDSVINMVISAGWFANVYRQSKRLEDYALGATNNPSSDSFEGFSNSASCSEDSLEVYSSEQSGPSSISDSDSERESNSGRESRATPELTILPSDSLKEPDSPQVATAAAGPQTPPITITETTTLEANQSGGRKSKLRSRFLDDGYSSACQSADTKSNASSIDYSDTSNRAQVVNTRKAYIQRQRQQTQESQQRQQEPELNAKLRKFRQETQAKLASKSLPQDIADIPVFHCTSGKANPITWGRLQVLVISLVSLYPSIQTYRYPKGEFTSSKLVDNFYRWTLHYVPGYLADLASRLAGGKPSLVRLYTKFDSAATVLRAFTMRQWKFDTSSSSMLRNELMNESDRQLFDFDLSNLDWADFIRGYVLGVRSFLLKEPMSSLDEARKNLRFVYYRNLGLQILICASAAFYLSQKYLALYSILPTLF